VPEKDALMISMKTMKMRRATTPPRHVLDKRRKQAPLARSAERKPRARIRIRPGIILKERVLKAKAISPRIIAIETQPSQS